MQHSLDFKNIVFVKKGNRVLFECFYIVLNAKVLNIFSVFQMTEGRRCQVHLLDDRKLELLVQVSVLFVSFHAFCRVIL